MMGFVKRTIAAAALAVHCVCEEEARAKRVCVVCAKPVVCAGPF